MSLEGDIFAVRWGTPWLALPIGLFGVAMVGSIGRALVRPAGLPFLVLAAFLVYLALAFLVNRARFRVRDGFLTVAHRPLPWPSPRVELASIEGLDVQARAGRDGVSSWELLALRRDREPIVLLGPPCVGLNYADLTETAGHLARLLGVPLR